MTYELLYQKYTFMMKDILDDELMTEEEFTSFVKDQLKDLKYVEVKYGNKKGFLFYHSWEEDRICHYITYPYGYYADDEKTMVKLFQTFSQNIVKEGKYEFSINLYANDWECIRAFHMMQFGNMSEVGVKRIENKYEESKDFKILALTKEEISENWTEIWQMTEQLIKHLNAAPVFYPGEEFTEEVYKEYFMSDTLELIAAYEGENLVGIIEWNLDEFEFFRGKNNSVNVGEAFVCPKLRGTGLSEKLLRFAERRALEKGYEYMWVEHGTANPNARGFWNKYFTTYRYELVRSIG